MTRRFFNHTRLSNHTPWFKSFWTFNTHFFHYCFVLRGVLGVQISLVLLGGVLVSLIEEISIWEGVYFALITSTTVGYGDITPDSVPGQILSVFLALAGTVFFGLLVAVATRAFSVTIKEALEHREQDDARPKSTQGPTADRD
jgi:voltage-gated potassium channel